MPHHLFFDTETGGLCEKTTDLLTVALMVTDDDLLPLGNLAFFVKPVDGVYRITPGAMAVNRINLHKHAEKAVSRGRGRELIQKFLRDYHTDKHSIAPVGWNLDFDLRYLHEQLIPKEEWEQLVSYRSIDVQDVNRFMFRLGRSKCGGGMDDTARAYGLDLSDFHTAKGDVRITHELYKILLREGAK